MGQYQPSLVSQADPVPAGSAIALLVGFRGPERQEFERRFSDTHSEAVPYAILHAALACAPRARYVVSPLVGEDFDAIDIATDLARADYRGNLVVVTPVLPKPSIVLRELREACPDVNIELVPVTRC